MFKKYFIILPLCLIFTYLMPLGVWAAIPDDVLEAMDGIVLVRSYNDNSSSEGLEGTGFLIGNEDEQLEYVITATSIIKNNIGGIKVYIDKTGIKATAENYDDKAFFTLLRLEKKISGKKALTLRAAEPPDFPSVGMDVYAFGFNGDTTRITSPEPMGTDKISVTGGTMSKIDNSKQLSYVHSASVNPMSLGGPLLSEDGSVIALNGSTDGQNVYSAWPIDSAITQLNLFSVDFEQYGSSKKSSSTDTETDDDEETEDSEDAAEDTEDEEVSDSFFSTLFSDYLYIVIIITAAVLICAVLLFLPKDNKKAKKRSGNASAEKKKTPQSETTFVISQGGESDRNGQRPSPDSAGNATIEGITGFFAGTTIQLSKSDRLVFGRDKENCNLLYPPEVNVVSGIHCEIFYDSKVNKYVLVDKGSRNGTYLGRPDKLIPRKEYYLENGNEFSLAKDEQKFRFLI